MAGAVVVRKEGDVEIRLDTTVLDRLIAQAESQLDAVLAASAFEVQALAMKNAPVDTGNLANSIKVTKVAACQYQVGTGVEYAVYQELGYHDRGGNWHSGKFYLTGALLALTPRIQAAIKQIFTEPKT